MIFLLWTLLILAALALYFNQIYSKFKRHGIKQFRPIPLVGNMSRILLRKEHFTDHFDRLYYSFPGERFVGSFEFLSGVVLVRDLELVKNIVIKDFEYFLDHRALVDDQNDPFFGRNLFSMKGQEWKDMRSTLSPAFTSSKMRLMVPFIVEVGDQMMKSLQKKMENSDVDYIDVECKDLTARYANDVIASCAFGLKVDSHTEENNNFYKKGKTASTFNFLQFLKLILNASFPNLMRRFKITLFSEETRIFFKNLVMNTMKDREDRHIIRPDMIHLLMEAKKGKLVHDDKSDKDSSAGFATVEESAFGKKNVKRVWSDDDIIAHAVLFFIAGFETVSSAMSFLLYELALHPEVQDQLVQEIRDNDAQNDGKFNYNSIQNLSYLDMVVSEVLRLWPPAVGLDRVCVKDYNMGKVNGRAAEDYILPKGTVVSIPTWSYHRDAKYFPDPNKFDPERFSEVNKHKIIPFSYMPFGLGPRNCIGSRFALCEVKVMTYQLLQAIEVSPCERTCIPAKLSPNAFTLALQGGHWLRFKNRK